MTSMSKLKLKSSFFLFDLLGEEYSHFEGIYIYIYDIYNTQITRKTHEIGVEQISNPFSLHNINNQPTVAVLRLTSLGHLLLQLGRSLDDKLEKNNKYPHGQTLT